MRVRALYRTLASAAANHSQSKAITFLRPGSMEEVSYTFGELFERAEEIGTAMKRSYRNPNAPIGLLLSSQEDQVLHYLAALSIGAVPAILTPPNRKLNPEYYIETMNNVLSRCEFGAVVSELDGIALTTSTLEPYTFDLDESMRSPSESQHGASQEAIAASFIQFSSGTTGIKKGVLVDDEAVLTQLDSYGETLVLSPDDRVISWLPLYHDMGFIACLNMPLAHGVSSVMIDPIDWVSKPVTYLRAVSDHRGTLSWHPNFAYSFMASSVRDQDLDGLDLSSLRGLVNCSEPTTHKSQQSFLERFQPWGLSSDVFKGCYAMAETTFALTHGETRDEVNLDRIGPRGAARVPLPVVSVGRTLPGVELAIMTSDHEELPDRSVGEIWVRSPFNFSGYYKDEEATENALVDGWYRTGDLGYRVEGALYVVGREKDVLIVAGVNVFPQDIEDLVSSINGVIPGRVCAFSSFDERLQTERVTVIAESDPHDDMERTRIAQEARQRILAAFQIGNFELQIVPPGWLVKSSSGKMARSANRAKWVELGATSTVTSR